MPAARARQARIEQQQRQRRRMFTALGAFVAVLAVVVILLVAKASSNKSSVASPAVPTTAAPVLVPASVPTALGAIPPAALASAARSGGAATPSAGKGPPPPGQADKPEVFYVGAEFCPYCAAERWALVTALQHFGHFDSLRQTHSASDDVYPNTQTFSFFGSSYTSDYLTFTALEEFTNQRAGSGWGSLQTPTTEQKTYLKQAGFRGFPFIAISDKYSVSTQYDPGVLQGKSFADIAAAAADPTTTIGKGIQAAAGLIVAALCQVTNGQPGSVCTAFSGA